MSGAPAPLGGVVLPGGRGEERCWCGKSQRWEWGGALRPAHAMRERKERRDERREKRVVFWFINFKKHIDGVSSSMFRRELRSC